MRYVFVLLFICLAQMMNAQCARSGEFVANDPNTYPVSGTALIEINENDSIMVVFDDDFKTIQGATLNVYLSKTGTLDNSTDIKVSENPLGMGVSLGGPIEGRLEFLVPTGVDFDEYDHVLIWCEGISELWGNVAYGEPEGENCPTTSSTKAVDLFPEFQIIPNPVTNELRLKNLPFDNVKTELFNQFGQQFAVQRVQDMPAGIYFLRVYNDEYNLVRRFVKQ